MLPCVGLCACRLSEFSTSETSHCRPRLSRHMQTAIFSTSISSNVPTGARSLTRSLSSASKASPSSGEYPFRMRRTELRIPCLRALRRDRLFPAAVLGPVECCALRRLISRLSNVNMSLRRSSSKESLLGQLPASLPSSSFLRPQVRLENSRRKRGEAQNGTVWEVWLKRQVLGTAVFSTVSCAEEAEEPANTIVKEDVLGSPTDNRGNATPKLVPHSGFAEQPCKTMCRGVCRIVL